MYEMLIIRLSEPLWAEATNIEGLDRHLEKAQKKEGGESSFDVGTLLESFNPSVTWWVLKGESITDGPHSAHFCALRENLDSRYFKLPLVILVSGAWVTCSKVSVPAKNHKQRMQAVPFALEEYLAEEIEYLHFALDDRQKNLKESLPVLIVDKQLLKTWLFLLNAIDLNPVVMLPDTLLIPSAPDLLTLAFDHDQMRIVLPSGERFVCAEKEAAFFLSDYGKAANGQEKVAHEPEKAANEDASQSISAQPLIRLRFVYPRHVPKDTFSEIKRQLFSSEAFSFIEEHLPLETEVDSFLLTQRQMAASLSKPSLQLLHGEFRPRLPSLISWGHFRKTATAACVFLCLLIGFWSLQMMYYQHKTIQLASESEALFRKLFPDESRIVDLKKQFSSKINQLNKQQNQADVQFMQLLFQAGEAIHLQKQQVQHESMRLSRVIFDGQQKVLRLELEVKDFPAIDAIKASMEGKGMVVSVDAANQEDEFVKARLKITQG